MGIKGLYNYMNTVEGGFKNVDILQELRNFKRYEASSRIVESLE